MIRQDTSISLWNQVFPRATVQTIYEDDSGDIWFGSGFQGIARYHNGKIENYTKAEGLGDNSQFAILPTKNKSLYFIGDQGASRMTKKDDGSIEFKKFNYSTGSSDYPTCQTGIETPAGAVLLGGNQGLFKIDQEEISRTNFANSPRKNYWVTDMKIDKTGRVWVSTMGDGLMICKFDQHDSLQLIRQLKEEDGLSTNIYLRLSIDAEGLIWAGHYSGISG